MCLQSTNPVVNTRFCPYITCNSLEGEMSVGDESETKGRGGEGRADKSVIL